MENSLARLRAVIESHKKTKAYFELLAIEDVQEGLWEEAKVRIDRIVVLEQKIQIMETVLLSLALPSEASVSEDY